MAPWYERVGVQVNRPPKPTRGAHPQDYRRPSIWGRTVVPLRLRAPTYCGVAAATAALLLVAGLSFWRSLFFAWASGLLALFALEVWWRRSRPPEEDRARRRLFSADRDDYI